MAYQHALYSRPEESDNSGRKSYGEAMKEEMLKEFVPEWLAEDKYKLRLWEAESRLRYCARNPYPIRNPDAEKPIPWYFKPASGNKGAEEKQ
jgi:hypothetical protein